MNTPLDPKIQTPENLLNYFSTLVKSDQDACAVSMDTCIAARYVLEEEEREKQAFDRRMRNMEQALEEKPEADENYESVLKRADDALYQAKENGRNQVEVMT